MYNMLTSNSQYLQPDYLQPLPTTLDAKKSPLALLAQTCSSIGKDPTPSKPIIPSINKKETDTEKDKTKSPENKRPTSEENKSSGRDSEDKPGFRTIPNKDIPPLVPISSSSSDKQSSPAPATESKTSENSSVSRPSSRPVSSSGLNSSNSHNSSLNRSGGSLEKDRSRESPSSAPRPRGSPDYPKPATHPSYAGLGLPGFPQGYPGFPLLGHGIPVDSAAHSIGYPSALMAHAGLGLSSASAAAAAAAAAQTSSVLKHAQAASAISPYVTYARVRTPSGATTLVPVCRDPYCTNCQLTVQNSHLSSQCNAPGCAQCAHEKSLQSLSGLGGLPGASSLQMLPNYSSATSVLSAGAPGLSSLHSMSSLYPHSALAAHQGLPFVCNWVSAGNEYCGKRFTSSEELLQHLRTHTTASDAASLAATYSGLGLSPAAAALAGCHAQLSAPGGLSPNSLRRSYPTSLSPILGASRYHPYKSALSATPAPLGAPQSLPALGPYYSPYALYGQRIGAAAVP